LSSPARPRACLTNSGAVRTGIEGATASTLVIDATCATPTMSARARYGGCSRMSSVMIRVTPTMPSV
jgi:hypothetical protein